ncbi:MAG: hypothetical protein RL588_1737 [Pseudomonadota bacterium]|jgi:hypothetical protein
MPFMITAPNAYDLKALPPNLPWPLVVAILDRPQEREGRTTAVVTQCFTYLHPHSGAQIKVPENYVTDFASIPPIARGVFPPFGRHAKAAVLHDWLYQVGEPGRRAFADRVFLDAMEELDVSKARSVPMYLAVRTFGGIAYDRASETWSKGFASWKTGDPISPPGVREEYFSAYWPVPPNPGRGI